MAWEDMGFCEQSQTRCDCSGQAAAAAQPLPLRNLAAQGLWKPLREREREGEREGEEEERRLRELNSESAVDS